jgi:hypothetical protein
MLLLCFFPLSKDMSPFGLSFGGQHCRKTQWESGQPDSLLSNQTKI